MPPRLNGAFKNASLIYFSQLGYPWPGGEGGTDGESVFPGREDFISCWPWGETAWQGSGRKPQAGKEESTPLPGLPVIP